MKVNINVLSILNVPKCVKYDKIQIIYVLENFYNQPFRPLYFI